MKKRLLAFAAAALCGLLLLTGCSGGADMKNKIPGTLCGVEYSYRHGSMYGQDFYITLVPDEVVYASYFHEDLETYHDEVEVSHAALDAEDWNKVEALVLDLYPVLQPVKEKSGFAKLIEKLLYGEEILVLDAGSENLTLTWLTEDGQIEVKYHSCQALIDLLKEIALACPVTEE